MKQFSWAPAAAAVIAVHVLALLASWPLLPFFLDAYYHLNVLQGFKDSGGIVLHAFWEWAPAGRPHLYPPAFHTGLALLGTFLADPIALARLANVLTYAALLAAIAWATAQWLGREKAFWTVVCCALAFSFLLTACNTLAGSWALIAWLAGLVAVKRRALVAASFCVALVFYTHLGTPWLLSVSWLVLGLLQKPLRAVLWKSWVAGFLLAGPWNWHLWAHRAVWHAVSTGENRMVEFSVLVYLLAAAGLLFLGDEQKPGRDWIISLAAGFLPMLGNYRFRFFSGPGLLPFCILAALALARLHAWLGRHAFFARRRGAAAAILVVFLFAANATFFESGRTLVLADTALSHLLFQDNRVARSNAVSLYYPKLIDPLVSIIQEQSAADQLIGCNDANLCALLSALSRRSTTTGMLAEAGGGAGGAEAAIKEARLYFLFRLSAGESAGSFGSRHGLQLAAETPMAAVFVNPACAARRRPQPPVLPLPLAQALLCLAVGLVARDLWRRA